MNNTEAAWLAGIVDSEGAIWCRWPKRTNVVVEIKMTHMPTLQKLNDLFPGQLVPGQLSHWSKLPQWRWSVDTLGADELLRVILPYMVTKRGAANAAIQLCRRPVDQVHMNEWSQRLKAA